MKNLHIIPTDKPSRLHEFGDIWFSHKEPTECFRNYNIYITSDEEIKEVCYVISTYDNWRGDGKLKPQVGKILEIHDDYYLIDSFNGDIDNRWEKGHSKKIILTTDQDLIADGVQSIDDTFLQWFVENPSCESVEISYGVLKPFQSTDKGYMIHLPDNEVLGEPKQETLEELAKDFYSDENQLMERIAFKRGYTECKENMYSEEEVVELLYKRDLYLLNRDEEVELELPNEWFEQFKNK
jgi:hypothetical protein